MAAALFVLASSGSAARIVGGNGNDTIRGTPQADHLYGKGGNDTLYGLAGNDVIVPGPGSDTVFCGSGRDTIFADKADVYSNCEICRGSGCDDDDGGDDKPKVLPGKYAGKTSQEQNMTFEVLPGGTQLRDLFIASINLSCQPPDIVSIYGGTNYYNLPSLVPIIDRAFRSSAVGLAGTNEYDIRIEGVFTVGTASGAVNTARGTVTDTLKIPYPAPGGYIICTAPNVTWTVSLVP